ncbi:Leucine-rich repeat flightless-interacting protein 1 [Myotis brandtii]|uniref:Leucine-rich repeat flightless-interacting protein 1 n=1 Tax=Myotis brandtii TaxID=109478 RepID=S7PE11_MYOBR|nr:Leucine-rich repeat flightless-interacting protein 1 [Myotis brandtii]
MTNPAATQNKEIDCLSPEAQRLAEARLAAKRAARAEAREIRMKELERQQKEASDEDERVSVGSRGSLRVSNLNARVCMVQLWPSPSLFTPAFARPAQYPL